MTMSRNTQLGIVIIIILTSILVTFVVYEITAMYSKVSEAEQEFCGAVQRHEGELTVNSSEYISKCEK